MTNNIKNTRQRRVWTSVGVLTALTAIASALVGISGPSAQATASNAPQATPVSVASVSESEVTAWDEFSGRLEAVERVDVRSRVAGAVQAVHFREGSLVKKGDLLITIDPAPYAADVERAEAQVAAAQARVTNTQSDHARAQRLWDDRAISQREFEERQNAMREAEANLRAAQAQRETARLNLGYTQVRAPVSGRIGRLEVTVGNLVAAGPGAPVLTTLVSVSPIYASFDTDEQIVVRALGSLPSGSSARAQIERIPVQMGTSGQADTPYQGHLQLIDNQVDAKSGTVRVRAAFDNKDGTLIPGQFARIRMGQAQTARALLVNERAVGTDQNKKFVLVVGADNKAEYREVTLGASVNGLRVVKSGLKTGERIVVNGLQRVRPGALVQPNAVSMEAKAEVRKEAAKS
jgi:membrane fusion protein, multidrug efflux system